MFRSLGKHIPFRKLFYYQDETLFCSRCSFNKEHSDYEFGFSVTVIMGSIEGTSLEVTGEIYYIPVTNKYICVNLLRVWLA